MMRLFLDMLLGRHDSLGYISDSALLDIHRRTEDSLRGSSEPVWQRLRRNHQ
jgi:hypothetical protein